MPFGWTNLLQVVVMGVLIWGGVVALCLGLKLVLALPDWGHLLLGMVVVALGTAAYLRSPAVADSDRALLQSLFHGREARILRRVGIVRGVVRDSG